MKKKIFAPILIGFFTAVLFLVGEDGLATSAHQFVLFGIRVAEAAGLTSINADTTAAQIISSDTAGTDVGVATSGGTTTISVPTASATKRGALSSTDWSTFNGKDSVTTATLPLLRTANDYSCRTATGSVSGCLSSTDWTTFNGKQAAFSGLNTNGILYATSATAVASTTVGTATHVLTSNGAGVAPTFQAAPGIPTIGTSTNNGVVLWNGTGGAAVKDTLGSSSRSLTWDSSTGSLNINGNSAGIFATNNGSNYAINSPISGAFDLGVPTASTGGSFVIHGGDATGSGVNAGTLSIRSGNSNGSGTLSGGAFTITGGAATHASSTGSGATVVITGGAAAGSGAGGGVTVQEGTAAGAGGDGIVTIGKSGSTSIHRINIATQATGANTLTMTNASAPAGNPAVYIKINVNGTNYVIPAWTP